MALCTCVFSLKTCVFNFAASPYGSDFPVVFAGNHFFFFSFSKCFSFQVFFWHCLSVTHPETCWQKWKFPLNIWHVGYSINFYPQNLSGWTSLESKQQSFTWLGKEWFLAAQGGGKWRERGSGILNIPYIDLCNALKLGPGSNYKGDRMYSFGRSPTPKSGFWWNTNTIEI